MREIRLMIIVRESDSPECSVRIRECVVFPNRQTIRPQPKRERNHTRCIGKKLLAITNPFGASAQG
jgi:hypothetical protein